MTLDNLASRMHIAWKGSGQYQIQVRFRGQIYSTTSNNSSAYDRIKFGTDNPRVIDSNYTLKGAYMAFYNEVLRNHNLI